MNGRKTTLMPFLRTVLLASMVVALLPSCLVGSGVVTESLSTIYLPDHESRSLTIDGPTATVPDLKPFKGVDPIAYQMQEEHPDGGTLESASYENEDGDQIVFWREYTPDSLPNLVEWVVVRPKGREGYELYRLPGFVGFKRVKALGLYWGAGERPAPVEPTP